MAVQVAVRDICIPSCVAMGTKGGVPRLDDATLAECVIGQPWKAWTLLHSMFIKVRSMGRSQRTPTREFIHCQTLAMSASTAGQSREPIGLWEDNATHWDQGVGHDGNRYWKKLQEPCLQRLLSGHLQPTDKPRQVLELACGNGLCSRWLASHGDAIGEVLTTDGSQNMVERAKSRGSFDGKISFQKLDVTNPGDFAPLIERATAGVSFDQRKPMR